MQTAQRPTAWVATLSATVVSTYALDGVATGCGVALAAMGVVSGRPLALVVLVASYAVWWCGLRPNLRANAELLAATGLSTSAASKLAWGLAARLSPAARRRAASAGYLALELAKEVPYYLAAVTAAVATKSVHADDALVFLAGTNLGAAAYEYAVCLATRAALARRSSDLDVCARRDSNP